MIQYQMDYVKKHYDHKSRQSMADELNLPIHHIKNILKTLRSEGKIGLKNKRFTTKEDEFILTNIEKLGEEGLAQLLKRTFSSIKNRSNALRKKFPEKLPMMIVRYSTEEDNIIVKNWQSCSNRKIAEIIQNKVGTKRSIGSIHGRIFFLKQKTPKQFQGKRRTEFQWSKDDEEIIINNIRENNGMPDLAELKRIFRVERGIINYKIRQLKVQRINYCERCGKETEVNRFTRYCSPCSPFVRSERERKRRKGAGHRNYEDRYNKQPRILIQRAIRRRILNVLKKRTRKMKRTKEILGVSDIQFVADYLEERLLQGMTWANHGKVWHIDHIIPCHRFDCTNEIELAKCFHYTNLEPRFRTSKIALQFGSNQIGNAEKKDRLTKWIGTKEVFVA